MTEEARREHRWRVLEQIEDWQRGPTGLLSLVWRIHVVGELIALTMKTRALRAELASRR